MLNHIWIIMDWNRRWAKNKLLPSIVWHKYGYENAINTIKIAQKKWIKHLTLWALSKENLQKRDVWEIDWIIKIINSLKDLTPDLLKQNIKFETIWNINSLPETSQNILNDLKNNTSNNSWLVLTLALVYSWQDEIIRWIKKALNNWIDINEIDEKSFRQYLDVYFLPPPDLIIRTWWDVRHSWFLLYDSDYSEYFFSEKLWPDFDEAEFDKAIDFFYKSKRNFWK